LHSRVVRHLSEFPVIDDTFMSRENVHEAFVIFLLETKEFQQRPIVFASRRQSASNQLPKLCSREAAAREQPVHVFPKPLPA
jgi:hypothetical protein